MTYEIGDIVKVEKNLWLIMENVQEDRYTVMPLPSLMPHKFFYLKKFAKTSFFFLKKNSKIELLTTYSMYESKKLDKLIREKVKYQMVEVEDSLKDANLYELGDIVLFNGAPYVIGGFEASPKIYDINLFHLHKKNTLNKYNTSYRVYKYNENGYSPDEFIETETLNKYGIFIKKMGT